MCQIYFSSVMISRQNNTLILFSTKKQNSCALKTLWILQGKKVHNLNFLLHIYFYNLSLNYQSFLSKRHLSIGESSNLPKKTFCSYRPSATLSYQIPGIRHQPPWLGRMDQIAKIKRLSDYPIIQHLTLVLKLLEFFKMSSMAMSIGNW
jgi:hypothetical protein